MTNTDAPKKTLVAPRTLKGFRDLLPGDMIPRNEIVGKIKTIYEKYGFVPLDTPSLEHLETLIGAGGEETNKELFRLASPEGDPIAMRFDLTVPFARLIAQYPDQLALPFRRYQIGAVYRADKPDPGRYRQFVQFDIDAAGSASLAIDAEIIAAMTEVMRALGLGVGEYQIRINNRKLVNALLEANNIADADTQKHVLRVIDKLGKVGLANVERELGAGRVDDSGDTIRGVGLERAAIDGVLAFIGVKAVSRSATLDALACLLGEAPTREAALAEMTELNAALTALGVGEAEAVLDPSLMRGLDYYTGPVFEAVLTGAPEFGSVMGGGRYDQLVARFLDQPIPATGVSIGIDRLMAALFQIGKCAKTQTLTKVLVVAMAGMPPVELLKLAAELRAAGIQTEVFFGAGKTSMKNQLSAANAKDIPIAVIMGEDELKAGTVSVKDLRAGKEARAAIQDRGEYTKAGKSGQVTIQRSELVQKVSEMLAG